MKWQTKTIYLDMDTGEIITRQHVLYNEYRIIHKIKTTKFYDTDKTTPLGLITITSECRRNKYKQGIFAFNRKGTDT